MCLVLNEKIPKYRDFKDKNYLNQLFRIQVH